MAWRQQQINNRCKLSAIIFFVLLALGSCLYSSHNVLAQTQQTTSKLEAANIAVEQAFNAVLDAEKAGGNVTLLLARLNTAGDLLSDSQNTYNSGTIANVTFNAEKARQTAEQVNIDAAKLLEVSVVESQNSLWLTFIFSVTGSIVFLVFLLIIWRRFKRGYNKKLLNMKPEVVENTS